MEQLMNSVMTILKDKATALGPSHKQGPPEAKPEILSMSQGPALIANGTILYDHNFLYKDGNSKPKIDPNARPLPHGSTSTARKRQGSDAILLSPSQHTDTILGSTPAEWMTTEGAACFGPKTALLGQDPLSWAAHVPVDTLTRSIDSLQKGDTVLAEKHDVMTFEVPQTADPKANRVLQDTILSTGLASHSPDTTTFGILAISAEISRADGSSPHNGPPHNGR